MHRQNLRQKYLQKLALEITKITYIKCIGGSVHHTTRRIIPRPIAVYIARNLTVIQRNGRYGAMRRFDFRCLLRHILVTTPSSSASKPSIS